MTVDWFGDRAVLVPVEEPALRQPWCDALSAALPDCVVRAGLSSVLVEAAAPDAALLTRVRAHLDRLGTAPAHPEGAARDRTPVVVAVHYDGDDLPVVADALGCSVPALVDAHQRQCWSVAMMGFAPGFGYLVPDGPAILDWAACARRDRPRERVPAGSVAIAAGMAAVYPTAMPGGWHLVGRTAARLFDPSAADPSLLHPGDLVRFRAEGT